MVSDKKRIRLIVNGDDFGLSSDVNRAIIRAHREGILTSASLMVTGNACDGAIQLARENPDLGIGIHLVLVCGKSILKPSEIIGLVNQRFEFESRAVRAGIRYYFGKSIHQFLRQEINSQFAEFRLSGLLLDHVNGHLHFHLHPTIFDILKRDFKAWNIRAMRLTRDPLLTNLRLSAGRYFYRISRAAIFSRLSGRAVAAMDRRGIAHTDRVFGLLQDGRITEKYLLNLLDNLWPGTFEIYCHPDEDEHLHELEALCSPRVKAKIEELGIELIRYQDLVKPRPARTREAAQT
ncbi:MAG: ChbG/HpnK family deacetylase [Pedosphaera sp.]|nr:ChbG/HpnK family deacetylase [Pedosphaera sp.]